MNFNAAALWAFTKLFVRAPDKAAQLVKVARIPVQASIIMIILAGVVSGLCTGVLQSALGNPPITLTTVDGQELEFIAGGPLTQGATAVMLGLGLGYAIYAVGRRMGGTGSLSDIMSVVAVLQMVMTVIVVARTVAILVAPLVGLMLLLFGLYVFFRGLSHSVNVGHGYGSLGKSSWVIVLSFLAMAMLSLILISILGLGPDVHLAPLGETNGL